MKDGALKGHNIHFCKNKIIGWKDEINSNFSFAFIVYSSWSISSRNWTKIICNAFVKISHFLVDQQITYQNDPMLKINYLLWIFINVYMDMKTWGFKEISTFFNEKSLSFEENLDNINLRKQVLKKKNNLLSHRDLSPI